MAAAINANTARQRRKEKKESYVYQLSCHALQSLTKFKNTRHTLHLQSFLKEITRGEAVQGRRRRV
eukprot:1153811-Pelagomonas_calceolata.AAC.1